MEKKITSPPKVSAATTKPSISFTLGVLVAVASSCKCLEVCCQQKTQQVVDSPEKKVDQEAVQDSGEYCKCDESDDGSVV